MSDNDNRFTPRHGRRDFLRAAGAAGLAVPVLGALGPFAGARAQAVDEKALADAARREGKVTFYSVIPQNVAQPMVDIFRSRYGIAMDYQRLTSGPLSQRYAVEAEAGNVAADALLITDTFFMQHASEKGWFARIENLPAQGAYPKEHINGGVATVHFLPHGLIWNTQLIDKANAPKGYEALLDPKYKGRIVVNDPRTSFLAVVWYWALRDAFGEDYLRKLKDQVTFVNSAVLGSQQVAAGAAVLVGPAFPNLLPPLKGQGAPVDIIMPDPVIAGEGYAAISQKAPNPNAARLLMNFLLSREGQEIINKDASSPLPNIPGTYPLPTLKKFDPNAVRAVQPAIMAALGVQ